MTYVRKGLWLLALALCSCTTTTGPGDSDPAPSLLVNTVVHDRFFIQSADTTELIVLRTQVNQDSFVAAKGVSRSMPLTRYGDSCVIGIVYGQRASLSASFMIDSVSINPDSKQAIVASHLSIPFARMSLSAMHSHFIALPNVDVPIVMAPVSIRRESTPDTIPYTTFMKGSNFLTPDASKEFLYLFSTKEDEEKFLDTIPQGVSPPLATFGPFNYTDSMIVGVVSREYPHITPFEIVALVRNPDRIDIFIQSFGASSLPAFDRPYHFVALRKQQLPFVLRDLRRIDSWID